MKIRPSIVLFGDSITEQSFRYGGWGASLTDTYSRKADIVVRGYGGYTTRWALFLLHHIFPLSSTTPPVAATVFLGANDAALPGRTSERQHVPLEEYKENLRKIVRHLKNAQKNVCGSTNIVWPLLTRDKNDLFQHKTVLTCYPAMKIPERTNEVTGDYANGCVEVATEFGVSSINLWSRMQETQGWQKKFLSDGLHLTPDGNKVVFEEVIKVFNGAWLSAPDMPYDFPQYSDIDPHNPEKAFRERCL
ncbi:SGNH hydrolase-type esterase superfamily protein [Artemisia annua]|uniref:SGNH hydrolase-type esterase superfamily protein n=1 Tax=Artemisia annua TaxID=35608 RepID=A0A2U1PQK4_ARTAN|nr:SGNH hydrolase-type esterase superfamily protein [Artemisia annua]